MSTTSTPSDRTSAPIYIVLFIAQFIMDAILRVAFINNGLYVGFTQPPASSPVALKTFVRAWNEAMIWASPGVFACLTAVVFGCIVYVTYGRLAGTRFPKAPFLGCAHLGLLGFLAPGAAALAVAVFIQNKPELAFVPAAMNLFVFWRFSRRGMWQRFCSLQKEQRAQVRRQAV